MQLSNAEDRSFLRSFLPPLRCSMIDIRLCDRLAIQNAVGYTPTTNSIPNSFWHEFAFVARYSHPQNTVIKHHISFREHWTAASQYLPQSDPSIPSPSSSSSPPLVPSSPFLPHSPLPSSSSSSSPSPSDSYTPPSSLSTPSSPSSPSFPHPPSPSVSPPPPSSKAPNATATSGAQKLLREFGTSGASITVATACTHPLDVIKVQQQMQAVGRRGGAQSMAATARELYQAGGAPAFYRGVEPALLRSVAYGGLRLGLYGPFKDQLLLFFPPRTPQAWPPQPLKQFPANQPGRTAPQPGTTASQPGSTGGSEGAKALDAVPRARPTGSDASVGHKLAAGLLAGATATAVTNPFELAKVRLQLQGDPQRGGVIGAVGDIVRREGVGALWKGVVPSMWRAASLTASQVAVYDECKQSLLRSFHMRDGFPLHLTSSMMAGVVTTAVTSPFDTVKSRLMAPRPATSAGATASAPTQSSLACALMIIRREGVQGLYKGWMANYARLAPQTAITFVVYEQLRKFAGIPSL